MVHVKLLSCVHCGVSLSNWNLDVVVFEEREKPKYLEKTSERRDKKQEYLSQFIIE